MKKSESIRAAKTPGWWAAVGVVCALVACKGGGGSASADASADAGADAGAGAGASAGAGAGAGADADADAAGERRPLTGVAQVAVGQQSACWRLDGGRVLCAGWVYESTKEDGRMPDAWSVPRAVAVGDATFIAVGWGYACAVRRGGGVACWGHHARYSRGSRDERREARAVEGVHDAVQVAIGMDHACALSADGAVVCWGGDLHGEVGAKPEDVPADGLVHVEGLGRAVDIVAGSFHTCARTAEGTLRCFGLNAHGELGDGTTRSSVAPVTADVKGVAQVVADGFHTCARLADTTVRCWGQRLPIDYEAAPAASAVLPPPRAPDGGAPPQPWELPAAPRPVEVSALRGAVELGVGADFLCGRMADGAVLCAGDNGLSQLGRETYFRGRPQAFRPVEGLAGADVAALGVREKEACVLLRDAHVRCWGYDTYGSLGVGSTDTVKRATEVVAR